MTEGLFNDDARPVSLVLFGQADLAELLDDCGEKSRSNGEIEKFISSRIVLLIDFRYLLCETFVGLGILKVALDVVNTLGKPGPDGRVDSIRVFGDFF